MTNIYGFQVTWNKTMILSQKLVKFEQFSNLFKVTKWNKLGNAPTNYTFTEQNDRILKTKASFQVFTWKKSSNFEENCKIKESESFNLIFEKYVWGASSIIKLNFSNCLIGFTMFLKVWNFASGNLERILSFWYSVILLRKSVICRRVPQFVSFRYFEQLQKLLEFDEFSTQNDALFQVTWNP